MLYQNLREGLSGSHNLVPYGTPVEEFIKDYNKDHYTSLYQYNADHKKAVDEKKSVAGIRDTTTNRVYFDFDSKTDIGLAVEDALSLIDRLLEFGIPENAILPCFTGKKGISVEFLVSERLTPEQFKELVFVLAGNFKSFDTVVNDANRIIRVVNTKHQDTGLFKIPLKISELRDLSVEQIKDKALEPRPMKRTLPVVELPPKLLEYVNNSLKPKQQTIIETPDTDIDWSTKPKDWKNCKWALLQGHFDSGQRHTALMIIAASCRGMGFDKQTTYYMCKSALKKQSAITGEEEFSKDELWLNVIEASVFSGSWQGGQYSCKTDPWLRTYCDNLGMHACSRDAKNSLNPRKMIDLSAGFKNYVMNVEKSTVKTGIPSLDKKLFISAGANIGLVGAPSSGKSALALNILNNTSKAGVKSVFASLDMASNRMYEKVMYKLTGLKREVLYEKFKRGEEGPYLQKLQEEFGNVFFLNKSSPTVSDLKDYILSVQEQTGDKVKLVMVDYFERISSDFNDDTQASKRIAGELQDLVNELDIALITLVQPNKFSLSGGADKPIYDYSAIKGSSFLSQSFRIVLSIWRPFFHPQDYSSDHYMQMAILKNDLGELGEFQFKWNGVRGDIGEMDADERETFRILLKAKEEAEGGEDF